MADTNNTFQINDVVVHCRDGLSTIIGTSVMGDREYFLVKTNHDGGETIYVPINSNQTIIRHIMNSTEADKVLVYMKSVKKEFNPNTKQRRDAFKRILAAGEVEGIAYLSRYLFFYNELGPDNDEIKLGAVDLEMLNNADNMLMDELSLSYNIEREKIREFVNDRISKLK